MNDGQIVLSALLQALEQDIGKHADELIKSFTNSVPQPLFAHVAKRLDKPEPGSQEFLRTLFTTSNYFDLHLKHFLPEMPKAKVGRIAKMMGELEQAAICQALAACTLGQFQCFCVDTATTHLRRFEELKAKHEHVDESTKRGRQKGGRNRPRKAPPSRRLIIRFLQTMAPAHKWRNQSDAAETISEHLSAVAERHKNRKKKKNQIEIGRTTDGWIRVVSKLIRNDPRARAIFQRHAASSRTHRPTEDRPRSARKQTKAGNVTSGFSDLVKAWGSP